MYRLFIPFYRSLNRLLARETQSSEKVPNTSVLVCHMSPCAHGIRDTRECPVIPEETVRFSTFHDFFLDDLLFLRRQLGWMAVMTRFQALRAFLIPNDFPLVYGN